jgi:hypothetical protein
MLAVILKFGLAALGVLDKLFALLNMQAAKKSGADEEKLKNAEAENEAIKNTKNIKAANARLDSNTVRDKLRKYKRD